jgi:hypothetical protein
MRKFIARISEIVLLGGTPNTQSEIKKDKCFTSEPQRKGPFGIRKLSHTALLLKTQVFWGLTPASYPTWNTYT